MRFRMKNGVGAHVMRNKKIVNPGDVVDVEPHELAGVMDKFDCLELGKLEEAQRGPTPTVGLRVEHRGGGKYNVINETTGEPVNTSLLTRDEAEAMVTAFESGNAESGNAESGNAETTTTTNDAGGGAP